MRRHGQEERMSQPECQGSNRSETGGHIIRLGHRWLQWASEGDSNRLPRYHDLEEIAEQPTEPVKVEEE